MRNRATLRRKTIRQAFVRSIPVMAGYVVLGIGFGALTDETYSLLCDGDVPEGADAELYRFLVSAFDHSYWVIGSVLGSLLGAVLPFSTEGIEFSMTALFLTSFVEQWVKKGNRIPALTGLGATLLSLAVFGPERFLIPAMLLITLVLSFFRRRLGREEAEL